MDKERGGRVGSIGIEKPEECSQVFHGAIDLFVTGGAGCCVAALFGDGLSRLRQQRLFASRKARESFCPLRRRQRKKIGRIAANRGFIRPTAIHLSCRILR